MREDIIRDRKEKREKLQKLGINPYPARVKRTHTVAEVKESFQKLVQGGSPVFIAGRVRGLRKQGGIVFLDVEDESGRMQAVANAKTTANFKKIVPNLDGGDFVAVGGKLFTTKRGEKSVEVKKLVLLTKSLRPLPADYYGLEDTEVRLRQRYLEMLMNPEVRRLFTRKAKFWATIRRELAAAGFTEVETGVLEAMPGGAEAEPFVTRHRALDDDFYLRISLEIALKKLMVGGWEKIFEIGRVFRNEGIDAEHLQDYTQMEFYLAYTNYEELMELVERMYKKVIKETFGTLIFEYNGKKVNWGKKWPKVDYFDIFKKKSGIDLKKATEAELRRKAEALGLKVERAAGKGRIIDAIFKKMARPTLVEPVMLINPPVEIEPLAKRRPEELKQVERFQVIAHGTELGKGFSEANDPVDQRERLEEQERLREKGDKEAQRLDEEFLTALEYGMPPTAGFGMSERLFAVLAGRPIRETVFFPLMKKKV